MAKIGDMTMNIHVTTDMTTFKTYWQLVGERVVTISVALTDNPLIVRDPHPCPRYYVVGKDVFVTKKDALREKQAGYYEQIEALKKKMSDISNTIMYEVD